jgi:hypothetical protein
LYVLLQISKTKNTKLSNYSMSKKFTIFDLCRWVTSSKIWDLNMFEIHSSEQVKNVDSLVVNEEGLNLSLSLSLSLSIVSCSLSSFLFSICFGCWFDPMITTQFCNCSTPSERCVDILCAYWGFH